jgi:hypothetical protein
LSDSNGLVAISIEGASANEGAGSATEGDELIDVGFYYGSEEFKDAHSVHYVQLKHSTKQSQEAWTASGLNKTLQGFSQRFTKLRQTFGWDQLKDKLKFTFASNRPIDEKVIETLEDFAKGHPTRHAAVATTLLGYVAGLGPETKHFFSLFSAEGGEPDLWNQRNLMFKDVRTYLAGVDSDAPLQLKELVTRKATTEHASNPSINRFDVLRALRTDEADLWPAKCLIAGPETGVLPREQEQEIRGIIEAATHPIVLHAEGGIGKSILAWQLSRSLPPGSFGVLYDCFGDGLYRSSQHYRHRHQDALLQIANELAAQRLCLPLIPIRGTDSKQYMRAFVARLTQAVGVLRANSPSAVLYLIVDAADNAVMAAREFDDAAFVPDLIRTTMPDGVKLVFTCRTHRRTYLQAPPDAINVLLRPFSRTETAGHMKKFYPDATESDIEDFEFLTSSNPRVQALALTRKLPLGDMLKALGPSPSSVERAIAELLAGAVENLKFKEGPVEAEQIELICQGLAVLRPLVPIGVLAEISGTTESAIRSFAYDLGRPLMIKGNSLHFLDEPSETWFRQNYYPDKEKLAMFLDRLKPLSASSSYVASTIPRLLLAAGRMDELVQLALSSDGLPTANSLELRDVEVQRLIFALKASLQEKRYGSATQLVLKVAGELAGVERQNALIQGNTDLAAALLSPDRIDDLVSRRAFGGNWTGAHHAYEAGLLAGRPEFLSEARSRLRMAIDWLYSWARMPQEQREKDHELVGTRDFAELAMAKLLTEGPQEAVRFLRGWKPRSLSMAAGSILARRLVDLGRYDLLDQLAEHGVRDIWLMLGLSVEACEGGHSLPAAPIGMLMHTLAARRIQLHKQNDWIERWSILNGVTSAVQQALRVLPRDDLAWARIIRRYLPEHPPRELAERHTSDRITPLRAYTLEAALLGKKIVLNDLAPKDVRDELEKKQGQYNRSSEAEAFEMSTGGVLAWFSLNAEIACGRIPPDFSTATQDALNTTNASRSKDYNNLFNIEQIVAVEWMRAIRHAAIPDVTSLDTFRKWLDTNYSKFWPSTTTAICRLAARSKVLKSLALEISVRAYETIEGSREHAETRVESYQALARAIYPANEGESRAYFERAVELSNRIGDENLDRWEGILCLAEASGKNSTSRPKSAYRLARGTELVYEYVQRDKHFDWRHTIDGLLSLCPASTVATISRWRDRKFGNEDRLLKITINRLVKRGLLPHIAPIALSPIGDEWERDEDIRSAVENESSKDTQRKVLDVGYRYLKVSSPSESALTRVSQLAYSCNFVAPDIDRLLAAARHSSSEHQEPTKQHASTTTARRNDPDWDVLFNGVDLTSSVELRAAYLHLRTFDAPYKTDEFYHEALLRAGLSGAADFCVAVSKWPEMGIFELRYLFGALLELKPKPLALRKAIAEIVLSTCRRNPELAKRRKWESVLPYRQLVSEGIVSDDQIIEATLEGFLIQVTVLSPGELFQMLESLSLRLTNDEADEALHFGLSLLEMDLRPEDGDGPWSDTMMPADSCEDAVAGYLWSALGSPSGSMRWQAAHAVRACIELGWLPVLTALARAALIGEPGPFVDKRFVFYEWHSRLWLNIALARCATEYRDIVRIFGDFLLVSAKEEHVLIRHFAAHTLREIPELFGETFTSVSLEKINAAELPLTTYESYREPETGVGAPSDTAAEVVNEYSFGIDIGPYWFTPLGRVFGISQNGITTRAIQVVRERMGGHAYRHDHDLRYTSGVFRNEQTRHSHGDMPRVDDLQAYSGYHATMIVAARLLKTHSVGKEEYSEIDDFNDWIDGHLLTRRDGRWLADRRDPQLTKEPPRPDKYGHSEWRWQVTADHLNSLMKTDEGLLVVAGDWTSGSNDHEEYISVTSGLVPKGYAAAFLSAAQTSPSSQDYFFRFDEEEDYIANEAHEAASRESQNSPFKLRRWKIDQGDSFGIDEYDPWGERLRVPGDEPSSETILAMGLSSAGDGRLWVTESGALLRSETWCQSSGYGREREVVPGTRMSANCLFLKELLIAYPGHCLIVGLSLRRKPPRYGSNSDEYISYPPPYVRYYLIEEDGIARTLKSSN